MQTFCSPVELSVYVLTENEVHNSEDCPHVDHAGIDRAR